MALNKQAKKGRRKYEIVQKISDSFSNFSFDLEDMGSSRSQSKTTIKDEYLLQNLGSFPVPTHRREDLSSVLEWAKKVFKSSTQSYFSVLITIERLVFGIFSESSVLSFDETETLEALLLLYRNSLQDFVNNSSLSGMFDEVELRSTETLLFWVGYCLLFEAAQQETHLVSDYAVCLDPMSLRHLCLRHNEEREILKRVFIYLQRNSLGQPLFHLSDPDPTLEFAEKYSRESIEITKIQELERQEADKRTELRWAEILKKKRKAAKLKSEIAKETLQLTSWKRTLEEEREKSRIANTGRIRRQYWYTTREEDEAQRKVSQIETTIQDLNGKLKQVLKAPPQIKQPLPKNQDLSYRVLFFLYMPKILRRLAEFGCEAQRMLLPRPLKFPPGEFEISSCNRSSWHEHYANKSNLKTTPGPSKGSFFLEYADDRMPRNFGYSTVDLITSSDDGIWYPDQLSHKVVWKHGQTRLNPFFHDDFTQTFIAEYFTTKLPCLHFQQFARLTSHNIAKDRGNLGLAQLHLKPHNMNKSQFLAFASLRSYPHRQLRAILTGLREKQLCLDDDNVRQLVLQCLFQVGDIYFYDDDDESVEFPWKYDATHGALIVDMVEELNKQLDILANAPKDNNKFLLVMEICGYIADYFGEEGDVLLDKCVDVACKWRTNAEPPPSSLPIVVAESRSSQCRFTAYAVVAHRSYRNLTRERVGRLVQLNVELRKMLVWSDPKDKQMKNLRGVSEAVMLRHFHTIKASMTESVLSACVKSVISDAPDELPWDDLKSDSGCYIARATDIFCVNILTGIVLRNGNPPQQLPERIKRHALYKRSFFENEFEISESSDGFLSTTRTTRGKYYKFALTGDNLSIIEVDAKTKEELFLLNGSPEHICKWGKELPVRLREMHSHWYSPTHNLIYFRPLDFSDRELFFIAKQTSSDWECRVVPERLRKRSAEELIGEEWSGLDTLKRGGSVLVNIFSKLEDAQFIHLLEGTVNPDSDERFLKVYLSRYNLSFYVDPKATSKSLSNVKSLDFLGFFLSLQQQLDDSLHGFTQYLILENDVGDKKLISTEGVVHETGRGFSILTPGECHAHLSVCEYKIHPRFQTLEADCITARLNLAAIYAATGSLLPNRREGLTGAEVAVGLLRQCWVNTPYSLTDWRMLMCIAEFASSRSPTLTLICEELLKSSSKFQFLHKDSTPYPTVNKFQVNDASSQYRLLHPRYGRGLTAEEEISLFGHRTPATRIMSTRGFQLSEISLKPRDFELDGIQEELSEILLPSSENEVEIPQFPISFKQSTKIGEAVISELEASWNVYHLHCKAEEKQLVFGAKKKIERLLDGVTKLRSRTEDFLKAATKIPGDGYSPLHHRLLRLSNVLSAPTLLDFVRASYDPLRLHLLHPLLSEASRGLLKKEIITWMQLCVYEDKFRRLLNFVNTKNEKALVKELETVREWNCEEHPRWLAFEVEGRLQIRPEQYTVVQMLANNKRSLAQLNMGLGKTRVILPLLILYWIDQPKLIRVHLLSPLLDEGFSFFHRILTASTHNIRLLRAPFNRDVSLTSEEASMLLAGLTSAAKSNSVLVVAPEHVLSFKLKRDEAQLSAMEWETMDEIDKIPYIDLMDEVDDLLKHRFQLIYAVGESCDLDDGEKRWKLLQAILRSIDTNTQIREILSDPDVATIGNRPGIAAFTPVRLHKEKAWHNVRPKLMGLIVEDLTTNPPYGFAWIKGLKDIICDFAINPHGILSNELQKLPEDKKSDLLVLRCFLACDILLHCLSERHRVYYGINPNGRKRIAIPFRSSDVPSERSEFFHPDCAIAFTHLAYYYTGLDPNQVIEAIRCLLETSPSAQKTIYSLWWERSAREIKDKEIIETLDIYEKLDTSNKVQMQYAFEIFRYNPEVINFWLDSLILIPETKQYSERLTATPWHLSYNPDGDVYGFSGTNDNKLLLPLHVAEKTPEGPEAYPLVGTNGKMLDLALTTCDFVTLRAEPKKPQWKVVLDRVLKTKTNALIDAGALMAGIKNEVVAKYLITAKDCAVDFKGVVFFHTESNEWQIISKNLHCVPLDRSPIQPHQAIVFFDESHCRGVDMKLKQDAKAIVTVGIKMMKDKLLQGLGRMRQLGENAQRASFVAFQDITRSIQELQGLGAEEPKTLDLIHWVLYNTIQSNTEGLVQWASQGAYWSLTHEDPSLSKLQDDLSLAKMYHDPMVEQRANEVVSKKIDFFLHHCNKSKPNDTVDAILQRCKELGSDCIVATSGYHEECERELQEEEEEEKEIEVAFAPQLPINETDWISCQVFSKASVASIKETECFRLDEACRCAHLPKSTEVAWEKTKIFCTNNYLMSLKRSYSDPAACALPDYMRPVDGLLVFPSGEVLLLSEREADQILPLPWDSDQKGAIFVNATDLQRAKVTQNFVSLAPHIQLQLVTVVGVKLFAGGTTFTPKEKEVLTEFLGTVPAAESARELIRYRGFQHLILMSDFDDVFNSIASRVLTGLEQKD